MKCRRCDLENLVSSRFCSGCGARLDVCCPNCQHIDYGNATYCSRCGSTLRHVPSARAGEVERKQATVLFVDIVGSTEMVAGLDAEEVMGRLRPLIAAMSQAVRPFDGTILRNTGDGLKVVFGAPRALEGHAILACRAALAMREAVRGVDKSASIRIGLHSGEVVAGEIDTGFALEQAVQGMTVHIASRIEQLAEPGGICISDACYRLVRAFCETVPMQAQTLKGVPEPMVVHRLTGLRPAVSSEQFRNTVLTTLQGRDADLEMLGYALAEALRGAAGAVGVSGAAGVGKSRVCFEFGERCRRHSIFVLEARCFVHGQATPMLPIIEMMRTYFRVSPLDRSDDVRRKIEAKQHELDASQLGEVDLLLRLLGVANASDSPASSDPNVMQARLRGTLSGFVKAIGREPGVLIFEDLHWLDPVSGNLLEAIIDAAAGTHLLMLLSFRPDFRAPWMDRLSYRSLALEELGDRESNALVGDLVGASEEAGPLRAKIAEQCAGNPFFAEELVHSLAETGVLVGEHGDYRPGPGAFGVVLPPTVEAVIGERIDRLAENAKALLQVGATIGKEFPAELLREVTSIPQDEMDLHLARLCEAGLTHHRDGVFGRGFGFRHPLIQEVAYAMQLRARRRELHSAVAKAIEKFPWGQLDEIAGDLARHCEAAGDTFAAATHLRRSAYWTGRTDAAQALQQWKKVDALLKDAPHSAQTDAARANACGMALNMGWRAGMGASEAKPYAEVALRYARERGNDPVSGSMLIAAYGRIVLADGPADDYVELSREALSHHPNTGHTSLSALMHGAYAQALFYSGWLRESIKTVEAGIDLLKHRDSSAESDEEAAYINGRVGFDVGHWLHSFRPLILAWLGRFNEANAAIADAARFRHSMPVVQFLPHFAAIHMADWLQDRMMATHHEAALEEFAERSRLPYLRVSALIGFGRASSAGQDFDTALRFFREALALARRSRAGLEYEPILLSTIADMTYRCGAVTDAAVLADDAIELARKRTNRVAECQALLVRAMALLSAGSQSAAGQAEPLLVQTERLIEISGAAVLEPTLRRARSMMVDPYKSELTLTQLYHHNNGRY